MERGIRFCAYPNDHQPRHVHGMYEDVVVIVSLLENAVRLADRSDAIRPAGAKKSAVRKILNAAADRHEDLIALWEKAHESQSNDD
jgi:Domain of unknown function (DUF4160)